MKVELRGFHAHKKSFWGGTKIICAQPDFLYKCISNCFCVCDDLGISKNSVVETIISECLCAHNEKPAPYAIIVCEDNEVKHASRFAEILKRLGLDVEEPPCLKKFHNAGTGIAAY